jgi:hypothetical protein
MRKRPTSESTLRVAGALGLLLLLALAPACHLIPGALKSGEDLDSPEARASEERAVREAFEALKENDLKRFHTVTITTADYIMRDNGLSDFHDDASYAGSIMKPEEREQQSETFQMAARGGSESIDFANVSFVSLGTVLQSASIDTVDGKSFPFKEYSIVVKGPGGEIDTKDLSPRFVVAPWEDGHRILELRLSGGGSGAFEPEPGEYDETYEEEEEEE